MSTQDEIKLPLTSASITEERLAQLRALLPEAFTEGQINFERLKQALGNLADAGPERYGLSWAGKPDAIQAVQTLSTGTLVPVPGESVNFDATENLIIEGDNLEVLKLLQKSYHGRVKMIYIDPPYNTGNDFIYPDNFREGLQDYLRYSGQVSGEGIKLTTNSESEGRFHSKWLNMMYPRLFLARNLLHESGYIFVSISDHEAANLRLLLSEVFGEENFIAQIIWKSRQFPDARSLTGVSTDHEYLIVYAREAASGFLGVERDESKFSNPDNDPRGAWMSRSLLGLASAADRPNLHYEIVDPATGHKYSPPANTGWRYSRERMAQLVSEGKILFPSKPDGRPREKKFRKDMNKEFIAFPSIIDDIFTAHGTSEIRKLFGFEAFDYPKPTELLKRIVKQVTVEDDVVLDLFAGSGSTADAVLQLNAEDGGNRHFILVQLPEATTHQGFPTIAHITRERVRRAIKQFEQDKAPQLDLKGAVPQDRGFKAFRLTSSNFKLWNAETAPTDAAALADQLKLYADHVLPGRSEQDILYELMLKVGLPVTVKIETKKVEGTPVYSIADGLLLICLAGVVTLPLLRGIIALEPQRVVCLDHAFEGNDPLKTNIRLEMQSHSIEFRTV